MTHGVYLWLLAILIAAVPAYAVTSLRRVQEKRPHIRALVFAGVILFFLPFTLFAALVILFQVFGIDMID